MPTALPAVAAFTAGTVTEAQFKQAIDNLRTYLAGLLGTDGAAATALATLGALGSAVSARSSAYTVVAADRGRLLDCSGTWTLGLTAAATLGAGFAFAARNSGAGTLTIDPAGAETIDGQATLALAPGESCVAICTGSAWLTVGRTIAPVDRGECLGIYSRTTSGTGLSVTPPTGATKARVCVVGAGGAAHDYGPGGSGAYCEALVGVSGAFTVTVGAAGIAGQAGGASSVSGSGFPALTAAGGGGGGGGGSGAATPTVGDVRAGGRGGRVNGWNWSLYGGDGGEAPSALGGRGGDSAAAEAGAVVIYWYR